MVRITNYQKRVLDLLKTVYEHVIQVTKVKDPAIDFLQCLTYKTQTGFFARIELEPHVTLDAINHLSYALKRNSYTAKIRFLIKELCLRLNKRLENAPSWLGKWRRNPIEVYDGVNIFFREFNLWLVSITHWGSAKISQLIAIDERISYLSGIETYGIFDEDAQAELIKEAIDLLKHELRALRKEIQVSLLDMQACIIKDAARKITSEYAKILQDRVIPGSVNTGDLKKTLANLVVTKEVTIIETTHYEFILGFLQSWIAKLPDSVNPEQSMIRMFDDFLRYVDSILLSDVRGEIFEASFLGNLETLKEQISIICKALAGERTSQQEQKDLQVKENYRKMRGTTFPEGELSYVKEVGIARYLTEVMREITVEQGNYVKFANLILTILQRQKIVVDNTVMLYSLAYVAKDINQCQATDSSLKQLDGMIKYIRGLIIICNILFDSDKSVISVEMLENIEKELLLARKTIEQDIGKQSLHVHLLSLIKHSRTVIDNLLNYVWYLSTDQHMLEGAVTVDSLMYEDGRDLLHALGGATQASPSIYSVIRCLLRLYLEKDLIEVDADRSKPLAEGDKKHMLQVIASEARNSKFAYILKRVNYLLYMAYMLAMLNKLLSNSIAQGDFSVLSPQQYQTTNGASSLIDIFGFLIMEIQQWTPKLKESISDSLQELSSQKKQSILQNRVEAIRLLIFLDEDCKKCSAVLGNIFSKVMHYQCASTTEAIEQAKPSLTIPPREAIDSLLTTYPMFFLASTSTPINLSLEYRTSPRKYRSAVEVEECVSDASPPRKKPCREQVAAGEINLHPGLQHQIIQGDGHCLYRAVTYYLSGGEDIAYLRRMVASNLAHHAAEYRDFVPLQAGEALEDYIARVRDTHAWAGNVEINILMRLLNRPIVILDSERTIRNISEVTQYRKGEPIFIYYNGSDHYDVLILNDGYSGREILNEMLHPSYSTSFFNGAESRPKL